MLDRKRAAMAAHPSQIAPDSWFLQLDADGFREAFGTEWYIRTRPAFDGVVPADRETTLV